MSRSAAWERFMASTDIDYERWHDGVPYDVEALGALVGDERADAEAWLLARADRDWRDLEGLLTLGTPPALAAVRDQLRHGSIEQRLAAARRMPPDPAIEADRERAIVDGLADADFTTGLSTALDLAVASPTPVVLAALFRAARSSASPVHAAAALAFIHGHAKDPFDWDRRPFYLQFADADPAVRAAAFVALCAECGVDPAAYPVTVN